MVKGSIQLGNLATIRAGMQSGRDKILIGQIASGLDGFEGRLPDGSSLPLERDAVHVFVKNGDIERYAHTPTRYCLYIPDGLCEKDVQRRFPGGYEFLRAYKSDLMTRRSSFKEIGEQNWWEWMNSTDVHFQSEKLIVPYRAAANRFSLDQQQTLGSIDVTVLALQDTTSVSLAYILSLLNSSMCESVYQSYAKELSGGIYDYYPGNLSKMPIRPIPFTTPADEREQLVEEAKERAEGATEALTASGIIGSDALMDQAMLSQAASPALAFVEERLAAVPEQADVVHDLLTHLAERIIKMHKQKQSRVEDFWLDLEGITDAEVFETLRHKGKWERTLWHTSEACRPFVDGESRSTRHLDESLAWNEEAFKVFVKALVPKVQGLSDLVGVYRAHSPAYQELVARIEATDWLIDQIIYQLYGLTEEEIAVVEGRDG